MRKLTHREIADFLAGPTSDPWIAAALRRGDPLSEADIGIVRDVLEISRPVFGAAAGAGDDIDPTGRDAELAGLSGPLRAIAEAAVGTAGLAAGMRAAYRATAAVIDAAAGGRGLLGTAFLAAFNPPRFLTAGHVVSALAGPPRLAFAGSVPGTAAAATLVAVTDSWRHPLLDIGILTIDPGDLPANLVPLAAGARAAEPQLVAAVGYPGSAGNLGRFGGREGTRCFCLGLMEPDPPGGPWRKLLVGSADRQPVAGHDCSTEGGFSGGPVIDATTGALLAVHVHGAKLLGSNQRNLAIPATLVFSDGDIVARLGAPAPLIPAAAAPGRRGRRPASAAAARVIDAGGAGRLLSAQEDWPDIRDRVYDAGLHGLGSRLVPDPLDPAAVLDQGGNPSCVGFALAATIDNQLRARDGRAAGVSPRLLYELARVHDEVPGEAYRGTTLRGGIKAFFHNGAGPLAPAREAAPRLGARDFVLADATAVQAGSYFRMRRDIDDFHSALTELGSVLVSARIHEGWTAPERTGGRIVPSRVFVGAHAFAVVGYDGEGFLVQNSWGADWGGWRGPDDAVRPGVAHWTYEDFDDALIDAWVVRIAVSAPRFNRRLLAGRKGEAGAAGDGPRRNDLAGRLLALGDDDLAGGKYAFDGSWLDTARRRIRSARTGPARGRHLLLAFHDGFADADRTAARAIALDAAVAGRAVAFSVAWRPAVALALGPCASAVPDGDATEDADARDRRIVRAVAPVAASLWRAATSDAAAAFADGRGPARVLGAILAPARGDQGLTLHVLASGLGALAMAAWLETLAARQPGRWRIDTLLVFTPCLPIELWRTAFEPRLAGLLVDLPIRRVRQWGCDPARTGTDRTGRYRGPPSRLLAAATGVASLGELGTLSAVGRLPEHRIVEANALSADFLDSRDVLASVAGHITSVR